MKAPTDVDLREELQQVDRFNDFKLSECFSASDETMLILSGSFLLVARKPSEMCSIDLEPRMILFMALRILLLSNSVSGSDSF